MPKQYAEMRRSADGRIAVRDTPTSQWMILPSNNPNEGIPSGRTDAEDFGAFKNILTGAGSLGAAALAPELGAAPLIGRIAAAGLGGMLGRSVGHGAAAMAPGHVEQPSFSEDAMTGGAEGAMLEGAPLMVKGAGAGMEGVGKMLGLGRVGSGALGVGTRAWLAREMGLGPAGVAATALLPPVAQAVGRSFQKIPTDTTTGLIGRGIKGMLGLSEEEPVAAAEATVPMKDITVRGQKVSPELAAQIQSRINPTSASPTSPSPRDALKSNPYTSYTPPSRPAGFKPKSTAAPSNYAEPTKPSSPPQSNLIQKGPLDDLPDLEDRPSWSSLNLGDEQLGRNIAPKRYGGQAEITLKDDLVKPGASYLAGQPPSESPYDPSGTVGAAKLKGGNPFQSVDEAKGLSGKQNDDWLRYKQENPGTTENDIDEWFSSQPPDPSVPPQNTPLSELARMLKTRTR